jgi:hypothetical protein
VGTGHADSPEPGEDLIVCVRSQTRTPHLHSHTKVQQLIAPGGRKADDLALIARDDLGTDARVSDLRKPTPTDLVQREGIGILREDVRQRRHGAQSLHLEQLREIAGRRGAEKHDRRVSPQSGFWQLRELIWIMAFNAVDHLCASSLAVGAR